MQLTPSLCNRRGFGHVVRVNQQLISILEEKGSTAVDMDNASLRVTLDVIGRVGFSKDFGATRDLSNGRANLAFDMMAAGERGACNMMIIPPHHQLTPLRIHAGRDEGIKRFNNPLRRFMRFLPVSGSA